MKLWLTTTENKCFMKMLWHLLGKRVKITVLLDGSSGTVAKVATKFFFFFLQSSVCTFKKYIFIRTCIYIVILT